MWAAVPGFYLGSKLESSSFCSELFTHKAMFEELVDVLAAYMSFSVQQLFTKTKPPSTP